MSSRAGTGTVFRDSDNRPWSEKRGDHVGSTSLAPSVTQLPTLANLSLPIRTNSPAILSGSTMILSDPEDPVNLSLPMPAATL